VPYGIHLSFVTALQPQPLTAYSKHCVHLGQSFRAISNCLTALCTAKLQNHCVTRHSSCDFCRAMLCKRGLCRHVMSVRLSVCLSRSYILSERINISSTNFSLSGNHTRCSTPNVMAPWHDPNGGVECRWGRQKSRFSRIVGYRSITSGVRTTATVDGAVYRTDGDASVNLCLSQPLWTTML